MPGLKCSFCDLWSFETGCKLEIGHYWQYRDCVTEKEDHFSPKRKKDPDRNGKEVKMK